MNSALIMAGGKGTRFWPMSTEEKPKQFLALLSEKTMLQMTVDRLLKYIDINKIFICTSNDYLHFIKEQVPNIPERNIILEPFGMNTAPCIAVSSLIINKYYPGDNIFVFPSDHLISDEKEFLNSLKKASEFLSKNNESIVTFGIKPNRPEMGYGYIKHTDDIIMDMNGVSKFVEKPAYEKAVEYLLDGRYLWNSGMFVFNAEYIISLFKKYLPNTYEVLKEIEVCKENQIKDIINKNYGKTDSISIDYGIMERADSLFVLKCDFGWDDVGNWSSLGRYSKKDEDGNVFKAQGISYNSKNNIILSKKKIVVNGLEDIILVETDDYIMISSKSKEQEIKNAKEEFDNKYSGGN